MFVQFSILVGIFSPLGNGEHMKRNGQKEVDEKEAKFCEVEWCTKHGWVVLFKTGIHWEGNEGEWRNQYSLGVRYRIHKFLSTKYGF